MNRQRDNVKRVHPIARLNFIVRLIACPFVLVIVTSARLSGGEPMPLGLWIVLGTYAVAWPHVAFFFAKRRDEVRKLENKLLLTDAAIAGAAIALVSFRPVPSLVILTAMSTLLGSVGGVPLLAAGLSALVTTLLLTGSFVTDFAFSTDSPVVASVLSSICLVAFQTMMGLLTYRTARNFVKSRRQISEQAEEIQNQNDQLLEAREEALQAAKAKSAFLATMSHEIRTPLNGVLGMTRLLAETPLTSEQRDLLRTIQISGNTLLTVINDVLEYSRIESGRLELEEEPLHVTEVVEESLEIVAERAREKGIELVCEVQPDVPYTILGDSTRLRQVVTNLVGNAVKFTEQGEVVVSVRLVQAETTDSPTEIGFYVRDTGIGIPEDRIPLLFTPFTQADASTTRKHGGSGLGLAISKRLVELMGGSIFVKSFLGQGTTFSFTIKGRIASPRPADRRLIPAAGMKALVVDDNATNRRVLCAQLAAWGFEVEGALGAPQALRALEKEGPFDLAVLDYHMPDMDGMTLGHEIRDLEDNGELPLILLSSSLVLAKDDPDRLFSARLMKPARQSKLFDSVMLALGMASPSRVAYQSDPGLHTISDSAPLNILVTDDNEINRNVAGLVFRRFGYEVDFAVNGRDAVDRVAHRAVAPDEEGPFDIVFMDIHMPEMDGLEATRAIRQLEAERPALHWPRIVAMTADAMQEDRDICLDAGMDDYLTKPLDFEAVQAVLRETAKLLSRPTGPTPASAPENIDAAPSPESEDLVDWSRLDELREYDTPEATVVKGAIASLTDQAPDRLAEIRGSASAGDADAMRDSAHKLKGAASNIGAVAVADLASSIEKAARDGSIEDLGSVLDELETAFEKTLSELHHYVGHES